MRATGLRAAGLRAAGLRAAGLRAKGMRAAGLLLALGLVGGCAAQWEVIPDRAHPFDAVIVPGCPSLDDGALSPCQMSRAVWAAILWRRGVAASFITSGAAVHSR